MFTRRLVLLFCDGVFVALILFLKEIFEKGSLVCWKRFRTDRSSFFSFGTKSAFCFFQTGSFKGRRKIGGMTASPV